MTGDDKQCFAVGQAEAKSRLEHWLRQTGTSHKAVGAEKVPAATDTAKTKIAVQEVDHHVRLSNMKTMIDKALFEPEKKRNFQVAKMVGKTVVDAMNMCALEAQNKPVQSTVSLALRLASGNVLNEGVVADVYGDVCDESGCAPLKSEAVFDAMLKNEDLIAPIALFVPIYVRKDSNHIKKEENLAGSRRKAYELSPSTPTSDPSDTDNVPLKK